MAACIHHVVPPLTYITVYPWKATYMWQLSIQKPWSPLLMGVCTGKQQTIAGSFYLMHHHHKKKNRLKTASKSQFGRLQCSANFGRRNYFAYIKLAFYLFRTCRLSPKWMGCIGKQQPIARRILLDASSQERFEECTDKKKKNRSKTGV